MMFTVIELFKSFEATEDETHTVCLWNQWQSDTVLTRDQFLCGWISCLRTIYQVGNNQRKRAVTALKIIKKALIPIEETGIFEEEE